MKSSKHPILILYYLWIFLAIADDVWWNIRTKQLWRSVAIFQDCIPDHLPWEPGIFFIIITTRGRGHNVAWYDLYQGITSVWLQGVALVSSSGYSQSRIPTSEEMFYLYFSACVCHVNTKRENMYFCNMNYTIMIQFGQLIHGIPPPITDIQLHTYPKSIIIITILSLYCSIVILLIIK